MEVISIKIIAFGMVAEKINATEFYLQGVTTADELLNLLYEKYPQLKNIKFTLSINRNIANKNVAINAGSEVALLPPFSGG